MTIVLRLKVDNILLYTARIAYKNTYDMRGDLNDKSFNQLQHLHVGVFICSIGKNLLAPSAEMQVTLFCRAGDVNIKVGSFERLAHFVL